MATRCIDPARGPVDAEFRAVPSKSVTHRALVAAALADGTSEIRGPLDADDTRRTFAGLGALGVRVEDRGATWIVHGAAGEIPGGGTIALGGSGTSARFLCALAALGSRASLLDGSPRLRERPMGELIDALTQAGAAISGTDGRLPIRTGGRAVPGGRIEISGARSSQFASAVLLAAPAFEHGARVVVPPPRVSFPYVRLTVEVLEAFGATVTWTGDSGFEVPRQRLRGASLDVEGDHSSASYLIAATVILGGRLRLRGLRSGSAQPDARFLRDLAAMGVRVVDQRDAGIVIEADGRVPAFAWDLADAPDLAPTAAVLGLFADGACTLSGLHHLRLKESDRLAVLADHLARLGARTSIDGGTLSIEPPGRGSLRGAMLPVVDDHRIAMAFAVAGLAIPGVAVDTPEAVAKSYPGFWDDLAALIRTGS